MAFSFILNNLDQMALFAAGLFTGSALYVSVDEVPAIDKVGTDEHWRFFPHMYHRAAATQVLTSIIAGIAGIGYGIVMTGSQSDRNLWYLSGAIFVGILVYSLIFMIPTNNIIIDDNKRIRSGKSSQFDLATKQKYLDKWSRLHLVRTISSIVGFGVMIFAYTRP